MVRRALLVVVASTVGCSGTPDAQNTPGEGSAETAATTPAGMEAGVWKEIRPGGRTTCALGEDYSFWVRPGKVNRLVVDFMGGGACWSKETCDTGRFDFSTGLGGVRAAVESRSLPGLYDIDNPENPLRDHWHVVVPYCTGDIHWGDADVEYELPAGRTTIHHRGSVNARAVLDWVYASFSRPERIFVMGCSAGSYGSILWSTHLASHYEGVALAQLGDAGAGIITDTFFRDGFPSWRAEGAFPAFIADMDPARVDLQSKDLGDLYVSAANHFPKARFAQYSKRQDRGQLDYFSRMGGGSTRDWTERLDASMARIDAATENFSSYLADGPEHCITMSDRVYTEQSGGARFVDWVRALVDGPEAPAAVRPR